MGMILILTALVENDSHSHCRCPPLGMIMILILTTLTPPLGMRIILNSTGVLLLQFFIFRNIS